MIPPRPPQKIRQKLSRGPTLLFFHLKLRTCDHVIDISKHFSSYSFQHPIIIHDGSGRAHISSHSSSLPTFCRDDRWVSDSPTLSYHTRWSTADTGSSPQLAAIRYSALYNTSPAFTHGTSSAPTTLPGSLRPSKPSRSNSASHEKRYAWAKMLSTLKPRPLRLIARLWIQC